MSSELEYIELFVIFLREQYWHDELIQSITVFLDSGHKETDVDNLLMAVTKKVEAVLRDSIQQKQGSSRRLNEASIRLLNSAVHCHLIKDKEEPLYALLYWILKEPRNLHHHDFKLHPLKNLILFILQSDHAIGSLKNLLASSYEGKFRVESDQEHKIIKVYNVEVFRPDTSKLHDDAKLEAIFKFSDGKGATKELLPNGNGFRAGEYDYRGVTAGTISIRLAGVDGNIQFSTASGATHFLRSGLRNCPKCGTLINVNDWRCPKCGIIFTIF